MIDLTVARPSTWPPRVVEDPQQTWLIARPPRPPGSPSTAIVVSCRSSETGHRLPLPLLPSSFEQSGSSQRTVARHGRRDASLPSSAGPSACRTRAPGATTVEPVGHHPLRPPPPRVPQPTTSGGAVGVTRHPSLHVRPGTRAARQKPRAPPSPKQGGAPGRGRWGRAWRVARARRGSRLRGGGGRRHGTARKGRRGALGAASRRLARDGATRVLPDRVRLAPGALCPRRHAARRPLQALLIAPFRALTPRHSPLALPANAAARDRPSACVCPREPPPQ